MERAILHSDLNCFYASVETMLNPTLRDKAVAVCGSTEDRHGIVLAKSEKAKKSGVKTGMVNWEARSICKDLIIVPPQYDQYLKYSQLTRAIYQRYTDLIEPFGMDECWLDVTGSRVCGDPMTIAEKIRKTVREELGLTVSIGVSFNKIFAKLGSDMKKPDAITEITPGNFKDKVWPLDASEMIYCGTATRKKLHASPELCAYRERYCPPPKSRPILCTDVRIPIGLPQKAFVRASNLMVSKQMRYKATLRTSVDTADDILTRYRAEEMLTLIDEVGKIADFD